MNTGYWRPNRNSTKVYKCPHSESCEGGYVEDDPPIECKKGYGGILCTECIEEDGI